LLIHIHNIVLCLPFYGKLEKVALPLEVAHPRQSFLVSIMRRMHALPKFHHIRAMHGHGWVAYSDSSIWLGTFSGASTRHLFLTVECTAPYQIWG